MDNLKPSQITIMASGAVLFIFSFLDFFKDSGNAWDEFGLFTFPALFGLVAAGAIAAVAFGNVKLPEHVVTFTVNQILLVLGVTSFLILFGTLIGIEGDKAVGLYFSLLGSIGLVAGTVMEQLDRTGSSAGRPGPSSTPPSPF